MKDPVYVTLGCCGKTTLMVISPSFTLPSLVMGPPRQRHKSCLGSFQLPPYWLHTTSAAKTWPTLLTGMTHNKTALVFFQWWALLFYSFIHFSFNKCCKIAPLPQGCAWRLKLETLAEIWSSPQPHRITLLEWAPEKTHPNKFKASSQGIKSCCL